MPSLTTNRPPVPILTYHQIAEASPKGAPFRSLSVAPADFQRQMAFLHGLGYHGLSMTALQPYLRGDRVGKVFGLTFDDGYLNNLTHALPVLQWYGFSSTCYVVSGMLGQTNSWDAAQGVPASELMSAAHLRQWVAGRQDVGAHTRNHVRLRALDAVAANAEITLCKDELEHVTGTAVSHFCYPFGEFTQEHVEMVRQANYVTATTTRRGRFHAGHDSMLELPRVPVLRRTSRPLLWWKLVSQYEDRRRD
ncbi:MAG: polysaccharide deacetylase family protein [Pseudomonadota bacterium]